MPRLMACICCAAVAALWSLCPAEKPQEVKEVKQMKPRDAAGSGKDFEVIDESFRKVLRPDSAVRQIARDLKFTEGPVWMPKEGRLLFSDIPADTIYAWSAAGGVKEFRKPSHNANGNTRDLAGRLVSCEHGSRTVTRTEPDGRVAAIASTYQGKKLNSPNDVVVKSDGTIWFTDPPYGIQAGQKEQKGNLVYRLDAGAAEPVAVIEDFDMPNGLCFSPDEKHLYVADSGKPHHIRRFDVRKDNTVGAGKVFCVIAPGVPDGIRCDAEGRLFSTAGDGVQVFNADGVLIGKIRTPRPAANCCFGGPDGRTLFITAQTGVYAVDLTVGGAGTAAGTQVAGDRS